ncbi:protein of unknown function [Solimonas aquatica]|uniref:DUF4399 domain-containing protein n=1 Tax=Solimonas aquatica TaxID=489703 RepID=A0A1H9IVJ5_9GAMM|nr:DUF4399 domain-containing protein [Solimonas aquatica]SEQ78610.1 protein of unknown function [Solimonas aquatica]
MKRLLPLTLLLAAVATPVAADMFKDLKETAKQTATQKAAEKLNLPTAAPVNAKVYLIAPANGATVSSPVKVVFGLSGAGVAPAGVQKENTGHHHLLIDQPTYDATLPLPATDQIKHFGGGQTEALLDLKPGKHTLQLMFADWKHQPFNPAVVSEQITLTVK